MNHINIDLETFSSVDIKKAGMYAYVDSPAFQILLFAYAINGGDVIVVDLAQGETIPPMVLAMLTDPAYLKHAYNAAFEWRCLSRYTGQELPPDQWRCTMLHGLYAGYTAGLEATGRALGIPEDKQKLTVGKALIKYFCVPCRPTKANGGRTRNHPIHDPDKWKLFVEYNRQDVVSEMTIDKMLSGIEVPPEVQRQWETDLLINSRGVAVDMPFVHGALDIGDLVRDELTTEAVRLSGLQNPNSVSQLSAWLTEELGEDVSNLRKETVTDLMGRDGNSETAQRMLEIRQELGKTSTKKYDAIEAAVGSDGRVRGLLQYYGANRTGRWAGRLVQVQNLPQTHTEPLDLARELVTGRKLDALRVIYGSPNSTLSQMIRTAFVAAPGNVLIDADFSAIEARVIAWLAGEDWRLEVFRTHGKIYEASASQMFGVPIERIKKGNPEYTLRQRGKVAELALGYQGGVGAMRNMDTQKLLADLPDEEVQEIVNRWRKTSPNIVGMWYEFEGRAQSVIAHGGTETANGCRFKRMSDAYGRNYMELELPSGRCLYYVDPMIATNRRGMQSIQYMGMDQTSKKWTRLETYGGKLVENVVQAIARDCLAETLERLRAAGLDVVFHVHDEVVIDTPRFGTDDEMLDKVVNIMKAPIPWAAGLPLNADGWVGTYFKKD